MKKDVLFAIIVIVLVAGACYVLAAVRPPFPPTPSHPFSMAPVGPTVNGRVIMRVNGEPITEDEFVAAYRSLPQEMQQQYASEPGKMAFAEQLVRMKLLEQEAQRLGVDTDPKVAGQLAAQRMDLLADAAASKITPVPNDAAVKKYYEANKRQFESIDLSHIVIAYAGGTIPPRNRGAAPPETEAMNKALKIYSELRKGADFATEARKYSDDTASAQLGGQLGTMIHGMLPAELEKRVFQIPTGQFSAPIPSQFGIHIFKVNSRGAAPYEQIRTGLAQRVRQQDMVDRVEVLRQKAKIVFDPKFFPEAKSWPSSGRKPS